MHSRPPIRFCKSCGAQAQLRLPDDGDTKLRAVCTACRLVHYENPLNVVGTVPYVYLDGEPHILLCLRNIEPRKGKWTLPAGFMELGETTSQGAARETVEEAGAQFEMEGLHTVLSVPSVGQVHLFYRARLTSEIFDPGHETAEARLFKTNEIPWGELAFRTVSTALKLFLDDCARNHFPVHEVDLI